MPKYTMRDSTGQLLHDIDDSNFSDFMSTYPDAVIVEKIEDETGDGESISTIDTTTEDQAVEEVVEINPDDKYRDRIKNKLSGYDPNKALLIESFDHLPTEVRMKLKDSDFELGKSGKWDNISVEGKRILAGDKSFDEFLESQKEVGFNTAAGGIASYRNFDESSTYDNKLGQYDKDLSNALSSVKQGQIPTSVLDGDLGAKIVGHEEEQVYGTLNNLYGDYGFTFEETGIGDNIKVFAPNGQATEISLDNWTNAGDKEQAAKLKSFLDLNKGNYNPTSIKKMATIANGDLDIAAMEKIAKDEKGEGDWDWVTNIFKEEKVSEDVVKNFDAIYDADIVKEETQKLNNQLIDVNKQYSQNQAAFNTYKLDLEKLQNEIKQGNLSNEEIAERKALLVKTEQDILATDKRLSSMYSSQIQPLQAQLQIVNAKKYVVEAEKGNIAGITANTILGVGDKITSYFNGGMLALKEDDIEKYWSEDPEQGKKALAREAEMAISKMTEKYGADVTNEYEQEFNSTVAGGVYTSMVEMGSMMLAAGITNTGAVGYGALMGLSIAGGEMEEMMGEDFEGLSMKERFGLATTIGVVNGAIEGAGGYFGGMIGGVGAKGISSVVRKGILGKVMSKLAGKQVSKAAIKKATNEIIEEGLETGVYALTKAGLKAGSAEAVTEAAQEIATMSIKSGVNAWKEKEVFDKMATEITMSNVVRAGAMGFLAGGPIGTISAGYKASKAKAMDKISDSQYRMAKGFTLNKGFQEGYSQHLQLKVMDPNDPMTQEQANTILRDLKEQGGVMRELDDMSLTIEGEKKAYTLLQRKKALQKQIDKATDKAIVKKQREDITQINEQLEAVSLQYNFESAFEAGLEQAREKTEASGKSFTEFNSSKEFEAKMKELGEQDDAGFKGTSGYIDNDGNIYINREAAKNLRDISVGQHELLHGVVGKQLGNVASETVQGFKNSLTNKELQVVEKRLKDDYGVTSVNDANAEEYFNALVDGVVKGDIVYDENVFTKLGKFIVENILRPIGFSNAQLGFKDGRQVYNFVKDYAKQSRRIAQGQQEGFEGEVGDIVAEGTAGRTTGARSAQGINATDLAAQYKDGTIDSDNITNFIEQYHKLGLRAMKFDTSKGDIARDEAISFLNKEFESVVKNYDPAKNIQFSTYLNSVIPKRAVNFYEQQIGDKAKTTSTDSDQAKQIAADDTPTKDNRTPREIRQAERKGVKVREKTPGIYNVDAVVESIRNKAKGKSFKGKNIKQLKGFALREVVNMIARDNKDLADSMFRKLDKNSDLNKPEMLAIQNFINSNVDVAKGSLLEGYTSEFKATGVVNKLLEKFYNKRSVRAKTGPGLNVQVKKPNISDAEFKEAFGITGKDQANWNQKVVAKKGGVSDILKGFVRNFDQVISSQEIREQLIEDGELEQTLMTLKDGMPSGFFSKEKQFTAENLGKTFSKLNESQKETYLANIPYFIELITSGYSVYAAFDTAFPSDFLTRKVKGKVVENDTRKSIKKDWNTIVDQFPKTLYKSKKYNKTKLNEYLHNSFAEQTSRELVRDILGINKDGLDWRSSKQITSYVSSIKEYFGDLKKDFDSDLEFFKYVITHFETTFTGSAKIGGLPNHMWTKDGILVEGKKTTKGPSIRNGIFNNRTEFYNVLLKDFDTENKLKPVRGGFTYGGELIETNKAPQSIVATKKYLEEFLETGKLSNATLKRSYNDAIGNQNAIIRLLKWYKAKEKNTKSDVNINDIGMFFVNSTGDMTAILRSAYFMDSIALSDSKNPKDYRFEHNPPVRVMQIYMAQFVNDTISEVELKQKFADTSVSVIPMLMDDAINIRYKDTIPIDYTNRFDRYYNPTTYGKFPFEMTVYIPVLDSEGEIISFKKEIKGKELKRAYQDEQAAIKANKQEGFASKVMDPKNMTNEEMLEQFSKMDQALNIANSLDQPVKKIRVFDFDDTLAYTKSDVLFTAPDGTTGRLNAEEFAKQGKELLDQGYKFDFSEFNKVTKGKPGPLLDIAKKIKAARGNEDLFVLTARAPEAQQAIYEFLKSQGVEFKKQNIIGLGNSTGEAKAQWLVGKAAEGYNDFYFADDAAANVRAVNENMSKLDVKSKTQLVKQNKIQSGKFSKTKLNFNTDEAGNMKSSFNIKDKNYVVSLYPVDEQGDYRYEFELKTKTGSTQDITGTGDAVAVFRKVYNGLVDAIKQNTDIRRVEFSATKAEPSRISLYTSLMEKLGKDLGWETDVWETTNWDGTGGFDFEISKPRTKQPSSVERVLNVVDVKSKTQESRGRFSKQMSDDFNRIIEETEGVGRQKVYSEARAKQIGSQKGKRKFWIPFSAEDMLGLIYPLLGKGKTGDAQMKWFKENLFNPFSKAMESLATARVQLMADFKALKENLDVPKDLQKEAFDGFTNEQALRMYIWDLQGMEIPGASKRDVADAKKIIEGNEKLKTFAEELIKINKEDGYPKPSQSWLAGTITTDLIEGLNDVKRPRYLQQWQQNVDAIFSKENLNKLEAIHGSNYREALENMLTRMKTGKNRIEGSNRMSDRVLDWINGSVGAIMFFNTRSAVLQLISSINFINWNDNNLYAAGKAFANQKQYWADFKMLMNSDFLVDRRNGLKINVSESEIADAAKTSKNKARAVLNYILKKGFLPTQIADSFAIASGGATFYRNRVNTYLSEGMTKADAEAKAFQDFRETSEESQQSSRPDKVSQQQASSLGRVLLAFANTPMQYGRLTKRAYQDLIAGRGDRKSNISKIIYYTAVQNMIFNVLQQAVTMLGFGDDEKDDEEKEEKYVDVANGMADSILRGLGIAGGAVSVAKNFLLDLYERSGRTRPEYVDSVYKLLQFSPPISSKVSKIRQAAWMFDSKKRREEIYEKGFALDNPAYEAAGKVISATTNLPVDRVYNKVNNIDAALAEDTETWESIAMLLGWPEWQIKPNKKKAKSKRSGYKSDFKKRKNRRNKKVFR